MSPDLQALMNRVAALENGRTQSTEQRGAAPVSTSPAIKVTVQCSATPGQVVALIDTAWTLGDTTQDQRALVGVVSRVIGASCEVVLWGLRYAPGTPGDFYYMSATPGVLSTTPPIMGTLADEFGPTEEWTHIVEVQVTTTYRLVRPDAWKRRVQITQTCELVEGEDTPGERIFGEFTNETEEEP